MKTFFIISANIFSVNTISISLFHNILCLFFIEQTGAWNPLLMPIDLFKNASCDKINIHFYVNSQESVPLGDGRKVRNNLPRSWLYGAYFYFNNLRPAGKERFNFSRYRPYGLFLCYNNLTAFSTPKASAFVADA